MAYSDVPLGNQRISATQPLIRNNFQFIEDDFQEDHVFNGNVVGQQEGTHQKMSLKGIAEPVALPTGCNAIAYLGVDNQLKLYRGAGIQTRNLSVYSISAAVNFNGVGGVSIRSSYNCTVTRQGNGLYTITYTNPLAFDDYIVQINVMRQGSNNQGWGGIQSNNTYGNSVTVNSVKIYTTDSGGNPTDAIAVNVLVFGGQ